jgi:ribose transport system ATP-binding protein
VVLSSRSDTEQPNNRVPLVELIEISKFFGAVRAVVGATLILWPGEVLGIVGDNAAGKSTLMKVLSGAHQPTSGEIRISGRPVRFANPRDARELGIEMVYQDLALVPHLDIATNIFLGHEPLRGGPARLLGVLDRSHMEQESYRMFNRLQVNIGSVLARVRSLSGGQRQAVAISRAVVFEARVIIMDEPTANLSVAGIAMVRDLVRNLKAHGISVILISHRLEDIFAVADRTVVMKHGHIVGERATSQTNPDEILQMILTGAG